MDNPRKTPRADWIDYDGGLFFITICTHHRVHHFGKIVDGVMHLSQIGQIVDYHLRNASAFNNEIEIPLYVIMPNHIHMIVAIDGVPNHVGTSLRDVRNVSDNCDVSNPHRHGIIGNPIEQRIPNPALRPNPTCQRHVPTLSRYIRSFKASVTVEARRIIPDFGWQSRYHDHIIRGSRDGNNISEYIVNNPLNWNKDCFYE